MNIHGQPFVQRFVRLNTTQIYSVADFAHQAGVSRAFVYQQIANGSLKSAKVGSRRFILTSPRQWVLEHAERNHTKGGGHELS